MAEAALCIVWGTPVHGRENDALKVYNETLQYWGRLQQKEKSRLLRWSFSGQPVEM